MKRSNILGLAAAVVAVVAIVILIGWLAVRPEPVLMQGKAEATSYKASSKIAGRIDTLFVREGQSVRRGELLYVLSVPEIEAKLAQARAARSAAEARSSMAASGARSQQIDAARSQWEQAKAGLELAQKTFDRIDRLYRDGVVPAQKRDEADAGLRSMQATEAAARAQYDMAVDGTRTEDKAAARALALQAAGVVSEVECAAADSRIYSPVDGEISSVIAEQGELVGTGYPVVTILDMNDLWITFNVKETLLPRIAMGSRMTARMPALGRDVELVVDYIAPQADFATWSATRTSGGFDVRTFQVRARPAERIPNLRPGMSALVDWNTLPENGH